METDISDLMKSNWIYYSLLLLMVEKTIQHIFVTIAFYFNWDEIVSKVVVSPNLLMISGTIIALLFGVSLWGFINKRTWAIDLVVGLALFDLIGEFVAQGRMDIAVPVSFLVALLLLALTLIYRRQV